MFLTQLIYYPISIGGGRFSSLNVNYDKIILLSMFFFVFLEILTRLILFVPTNISVFSYGFKNSVIFEIVDLSKFQIIIADKEKKFIKTKKLKSDKIKFWIFGG